MIGAIGECIVWLVHSLMVFADTVLSTGCDLAYYCNECASEDKLEVKDANGVHIQKTCTDGQGRSIPCDAVEAAIADRHKAFHFGG